MYLYSFERIVDGACIPIGPCPSDEIAVALLGKQVGAQFSLGGDSDPEYLMKKSDTGWGWPNIPICRVAKSQHDNQSGLG